MLLKLYVFFLLIKLLLTSDDDSCDQYVQPTTGISLGFIGGKCIAVTKSQFNGGLSTCNNIGQASSTFVQVSIDSDAENRQIVEELMNVGISTSYIGYVYDGSSWSWMNGDISTYVNWANAPEGPTTIEPTTTQPITVKPIRSTLPPDQQRRSTAVVIAIDASLYSTSALTFAQVNFASSLSHYIADRGPSEFAIFVYGCSQISPWISQYPGFVSTSEQVDQMIRSVNETIVHDCVRTNPLDFKTMFSNQGIVYYNRYSFSPRPFTSQYLSMIYFSSSTNSSNIKETTTLYPIGDSSVITINVGNQSSSVSVFSIPSGKNWINVNSVQDIENLVLQVDAIIFGSGTTNEQQSYKMSQNSLEVSNDAVTATDCAYINVTDGKWYSNGTCKGNKINVMCQYFVPTPEPPPTVNPTIAWSDPCLKEETGFSYFNSLKNAKCYRLSTNKKQFASAEDECLSNHPLFLHSPKLTSVQSVEEMNQLDTLVSEKPNEGMFWIGLRRNPSQPDTWYFVNGDTYATTDFNNWRDGYPRDADGCDCVAYVINDKSWVNTDCNKNLYSICAFRFNSTGLA